MRLSIKIIVGAAIVAASVAAATFGASAPAAAAKQTLRLDKEFMQSAFDVSARKRSVKNWHNRLRVFRLSRQRRGAAEIHKRLILWAGAAHLYPFAQNGRWF